MSDKKYPSNLYLESVTTSVDFASHVSVEAVIVMAKELLALRKASLMPSELTAENGAKAALMGEFKEKYSISCPACFGDDDCETCDGSGRIHVEVPVSWTTIKEIWAKGIEHFQAAAPEVE